MMTTKLNQIVLTGGPGSGKSTLLAALAAAGQAVAPEVGRAIIQEQMATGGTALPWLRPMAFAQAMLAREQVRHQGLPAGPAPVFLDRGWLDVIGYLRLENLCPPAAMLSLGAEWPRYQHVLIMPPWAEIYTQDAERKQDFTVAVHTHDVMRQTYIDDGYAPIEIPRGTVAERLAFVCDHVGVSL